METEKRNWAVNLEILSVGPLFREVDHRWLQEYIKRPSFYTHVPITHTLLS